MWGLRGMYDMRISRPRVPSVAARGPWHRWTWHRCAHVRPVASPCGPYGAARTRWTVRAARARCGHAKRAVPLWGGPFRIVRFVTACAV